MAATQCLFILSTKSAGSSALQRRIAAIAEASTVPHTKHYMNETLYWTKAGSILGLKQHKLANSSVPYSYERAVTETTWFLEQNLGTVPNDITSKQGLFDGWSALCQKYGPLFLEKSPHHLYQDTIIALMEEYADATPDISFHFIGLIRNPVDTLYSSWRRFGVSPAQEEVHWRRAYQNLKAFQARRPDLVSIVRYEDLVAGDKGLDPLFEFLGGAPEKQDDATRFRNTSMSMWKSDRWFGFTLDPETYALAQSYGYSDEDLTNPNAGPWAPYRYSRLVFSRAKAAVPKQVKDALNTYRSGGKS